MVHKLGPYRVIDLSTFIVPGHSRLCEVTPIWQKKTEDWHSELRCESHLGTHVEMPRHIGIEKDALSLAVTQFMGRAALYHTDGKRIISDYNVSDSPEIVLLDSNHLWEPFNANEDDRRPQLTLELVQSLFSDCQLKAIGLGTGVAIENDNAESLAIHRYLLHRDILLIEVLRNLDQIRDDVFFFCAQPMPIGGLDSCCVRAFAIEGMPGFRPEPCHVS